MKALQTFENQRGQGAIEYILILLVVMVIALGALYQFNSAFAKFAENYFGEYLACLLETGDLPNLGAPTSAPCDAEFEEFSLSDGRRKSVAKVEGKGVKEKISEAAPKEASGAREYGGGRRGAPSRFRSKGSARVKTATAGTDAGGNKAPSVSIESDSFSGRSRSLANSSVGTKKIETNALLGRVAEEKEKKDKVTEKKAVGDESNREGREGRLTVKIQQKKTVEAKSEPMSFGKFIKYLLIAGIIIAIVIFLGGQVLQISKEWE